MLPVKIMTNDLFDPIELAESTRKEVCDGDRRRYYRFRPSRFYGGIGTADCYGCLLRCRFCWAWKIVSSPVPKGVFRTPAFVAEKLVTIAEQNVLTPIKQDISS